LDEASIEIATPGRDGIEAERTVFQHAGGEGGSLGVSVSLDYRNRQKTIHQKK
jgi:hypothetical protein